MSRPVPIILAALMQIIAGVGNIVVGTFFFIFLMPTPLMFVPIIGGAFYIVAVYGLWKLRKWGGYLSIILSILAQIPSIIFPPIYGFTSLTSIRTILFIYAIYSVLIIIFVAVRRKRLIS